MVGECIIRQIQTQIPVKKGTEMFHKWEEKYKRKGLRFRYV